MKSALLLSVFSAAQAKIMTDYVRDVMTEHTSRAFQKDPITGLYRCEPGFTGSDCTQHTCPYSLAFATGNTAMDWLYTPSNAREVASVENGDSGGQRRYWKDTTFENQHVYKECGGRGLCDRSTGECKCFGSFTGEGCKRTTCPNDCSGHGVCLTDANSFYYLGQTPSNAYGDELPDYAKVWGTSTWGNHWTWLKFQQCHCDRGYEGDDCSLRQCPKGDDPETECDDEKGNDVQHAECEYQGDAKAAFISMKFEDQFGGVYTTRPIMLAQFDGGAGMTAAENAESIQNALEALPNFAIPSVEVDYSIKDDGDDEGKPSFSITFTDGHNSGKQKLIGISVSTACDSGAQPKFKTTEDDGDIACLVTRQSADNGDYKEQATCSNRGVCDSGTGRCTCFDGFFGLHCDHVNTYI
jgi:hypothetical protein